jgi:hypothetical protein
MMIETRGSPAVTRRPLPEHVPDIGDRLAGLDAGILGMRGSDDHQVRLGQHLGQRRQIRVGGDVGVRAQHPVRLERQEPLELVGEAGPDIVRPALERHPQDAHGQ